MKLAVTHCSGRSAPLLEHVGKGWPLVLSSLQKPARNRQGPVAPGIKGARSRFDSETIFLGGQPRCTSQSWAQHDQWRDRSWQAPRSPRRPCRARLPRAGHGRSQSTGGGPPTPTGWSNGRPIFASAAAGRSSSGPLLARTSPAGGEFLEIRSAAPDRADAGLCWDHPTLGRRKRRSPCLLQPIAAGTRLTICHGGFGGLRRTIARGAKHRHAAAGAEC